jgi:16S rRNA (uracil1498-N3)-methyltransferase
MKQSLKAYRPVLNEMTRFRDFVSQAPDDKKYIAHCEPTDRKLLSHILPTGQDVSILIGPEGDFSPEEIQFAMEHGFQPVSLGESRLRTETAGVVACHTVHLINELK